MLKEFRALFHGELQAQHITASQIAETAGMHRTTIYRSLRNKNVKMSTLSSIAHALGFAVHVRLEPVAYD
jgi:DNA-binding phage protein